MEKFDHEGYRDQLAKDLKNTEDHEERREILESESGTVRYEKAETEHQNDREEYLKWLENGERAEVIAKHFMVDAFGPELGQKYVDSGTACLSLGCFSLEGGQGIRARQKEIKRFQDYKKEEHNVRPYDGRLNGLRNEKLAESFIENIEGQLNKNWKDKKGFDPFRDFFKKILKAKGERKLCIDNECWNYEKLIGFIKENLKKE